MITAYAKLHILLARDSRLALVIRHGTAKSVCTLLWDRARDTFTLGQWIRGRIDTATCDLSPDGAHFIYTASRYGALKVDYWTAVSRTPYLKALAYYPWRGLGGWFVNNRDYCVPGGAPHARASNTGDDDREHPSLWRVAAEAPQPSLYSARLLRGGWTLEDCNAKPYFVRKFKHGWTLRHGASFQYRLSSEELAVDTSGWDWADIDGNRLVWTVKGCLWAGRMGETAIEDARLLRDFNGMGFEAIAAPYEGGRPVLSRAPPAPPPAQPPRARKRGKIRKKPDRAKVRPEDE